jgi:glycosyltransferase involved in cell wall biosynthesis
VTRILVLGDTAGTGFGTVTRDLSSALVARGEDVYIVSMNESADFHVDPGFPANLRDRLILLGHDEGWVALAKRDDEGQARRVALIATALGIFTGKTAPGGWKPDVVLAIGDVASLKMSPWPSWLPPDMPAFNYVPVEGIDLPPRWGLLWDRVKPVAMSEFGADEIEKVTKVRPPVVYHGVDPGSFYPVSGHRPLVVRTGRGRRGLKTLRSRAECRAMLGWPKDATIIFRADRHMPRKMYGAMFRGLAPVLARHPDVGFIFHCRTVDEGGDLLDEASKYPDAIAARIASTSFHDTIGGVDRKMLCAMYNAADIYLSTSAEGFGLTIAEALACGTPAIGLDYSAVPEVIGPAGITVPFGLVDNVYSYFWATPNREALTEAIESLVTNPAERRRLGALGPGHVARFSWESAAEAFSLILGGATPVAPREVPLARRLAALGLTRG